MIKIIILAISLTFLPAYAESTVSISMEKTTYGYCEKLFYTINVSEVTGEPAIIHIIDSSGKKSSAIPILITLLENPIPSLVPFEKEIFPLGEYQIQVEYAGEKTSSKFELADLGKKCIPSTMNPIISNWLSGNISDGFLIDSFKKFVDNDVIDIPFEINKDNIYDIDIPEWVKSPASWWLQGAISNDELANIINYLIENKIVFNESEII